MPHLLLLLRLLLLRLLLLRLLLLMVVVGDAGTSSQH
jgi:hypothetical protein